MARIADAKPRRRTTKVVTAIAPLYRPDPNPGARKGPSHAAEGRGDRLSSFRRRQCTRRRAAAGQARALARYQVLRGRGRLPGHRPPGGWYSSAGTEPRSAGRQPRLAPTVHDYGRSPQSASVANGAPIPSRCGCRLTSVPKLQSIGRPRHGNTEVRGIGSGCAIARLCPRRNKPHVRSPTVVVGGRRACGRRSLEFKARQTCRSNQGLELEGRFEAHPRRRTLRFDHTLIDHRIGSQTDRAANVKAWRQPIVYAGLHIPPLAETVCPLFHAQLQSPTTLPRIPFEGATRRDWPWAVTRRGKIVGREDESRRCRLSTRLTRRSRESDRGKRQDEQPRRRHDETFEPPAPTQHVSIRRNLSKCPVILAVNPSKGTSVRGRANETLRVARKPREWIWRARWDVIDAAPEGRRHWAPGQCGHDWNL